MMKTSQRIAVTAMASVFEEAGVSWRTQRGGKHLCVVAVDPAGHEHKLTVAGSPRADALVRQMGLGEQRPAERRKVKARHRRRDPIERTRFTWEAPDPDEGPLRDPWEALKGLRFAEPIQVEPPRPAPAPTFWSRIAAFFRFQSA
jgi:hypothetical protein